MGHSQSSEVKHEEHHDQDVTASSALDQPVAAHEELNLTTSRGLAAGTTVREATEPTADELASLSKACDKLYHLDVNKLRWNVDFAINMQAGTSTSGQRDAARDPLITFITPQALQRPTYAAFLRLLDNYTPQAGVREATTPAEEAEIRKFLDEAMKTLPMVYAHRYLVAKGAAPANLGAFKQLLYDAWFGYYRREAQEDSCGFEHVFVGEIRDGEVIGFHNWLQFYLEEQKGTANYLGYCFARRGSVQAETADPTPNVVTIRFTWHGVAKIKSSMFLGCSPEFEFALFTLCFFSGRQGDNFVQIGDYTVNVQSFPIRTAKGNRVGTSFPIALGWDDSIDATE